MEKVNKETKVKRKKHMLERNLFSLTVFGENLLADDVHSSVAMARHVQLALSYSLEA